MRALLLAVQVEVAGRGAKVTLRTMGGRPLCRACACLRTGCLFLPSDCHAICRLCHSSLQCREMKLQAVLDKLVLRHKGCRTRIWCVIDDATEQRCGMQVLAPYDAEDARGLLKAAIRDPDPIVFLENEILYGESFPVDDKVMDENFTVPIGKAKARLTHQWPEQRLT